MTLFMHVVSDPLNPMAMDDIALMEVVTGLFGRLKFLSGGLRSFDQAKEIVRMAQLGMHNARMASGILSPSADSDRGETNYPAVAPHVSSNDNSPISNGEVQKDAVTSHTSICDQFVIPDFALTPSCGNVTGNLDFFLHAYNGNGQEAQNMTQFPSRLCGDGTPTASNAIQYQSNGLDDTFGIASGVPVEWFSRV
jgi:hypothetical protein